MICDLPAHDLGYCIEPWTGFLLFVLGLLVTWAVMRIDGWDRSI